MITEIEKAENDLLACATYLAEKIKSADGHATAVSEVISHHLAKNNVDLAADLANSIDEPFTRDGLLTQIAVKCAEIDDDEYALQLVEAIEDFCHQSLATEKIVAIKAQKKEFEKVFEIAESLDDKSNALASIAVCQPLDDALQTIDEIEFPFVKAHALLELYYREEDVDLIENAVLCTDEIEFNEEKLRALNDIAITFISANRQDRAIEILSKALQTAEKIDGVRRDNYLSEVSLNFFRAGSVDLADRTLDLIADKYQIATTLFGFSKEYQAKENLDDSLESLDESYEMLKSQPDREVRDSNARFELFAVIAVRFAVLGKNERGIEIATQNPVEDTRNYALTQIAQICILQGKDSLAKQSLDLICQESAKMFAMISLSEAYKKAEKFDEAEKILLEAHTLGETVPQLPQRSIAFNDICENLGETAKSREIATENLTTISRILDETQRAIALARLSETFETLNFTLNESDKELLARMVRKTQ
jgi:tetratricopeptide (TPR) repeat protein